MKLSDLNNVKAFIHQLNCGMQISLREIANFVSSTVCLTRFPFYRYQHFSAFYVILSGGMELDYSRSGHCSPIDEIKKTTEGAMVVLLVKASPFQNNHFKSQNSFHAEQFSYIRENGSIIISPIMGEVCGCLG